MEGGDGALLISFVFVVTATAIVTEARSCYRPHPLLLVVLCLFSSVLATVLETVETVAVAVAAAAVVRLVIDCHLPPHFVLLLCHLRCSRSRYH